MYMKPPSILPSKCIRQSLGKASRLALLLFAFSTFVVITGAWSLQAQSGNLRSRAPGGQRIVPAQSGKWLWDDGEAAKKQQHTPLATAISQPPAFQASAIPTSVPPQTPIVTWDNRGLEIEAWNSSLNEILREIAAKTGAKLEGVTQDQRIFGSYGPGTGSDVLSKLLEGSGYNVLIFRGHGGHSPLTISLSARLPLGSRTNLSGQTRRYAETVKPLEPDREKAEEPTPTGSQANQDPYNIGGTPHDPVQFMQEILNRQQLIDQKEQSEGSHQPQ